MSAWGRSGNAVASLGSERRMTKTQRLFTLPTVCCSMFDRQVLGNATVSCGRGQPLASLLRGLLRRPSQNLTSPAGTRPRSRGRTYAEPRGADHGATATNDEFVFTSAETSLDMAH